MTAPAQSKRWHWLRRCLLAAAVVLTLIAAFYTEEKVRGKRAWENCKRELEAKGIKMDQEADIPPPVPDDQNVFAVPEMRQWFLGNGASDLDERIPDLDDFEETNHPSIRMVVAEVAYSLPGSNSPAGFAVLSYGDPKAKAELAKLIENAIGPCFIDPYDFPHMLRRPEAIQPAKILLQCQTAPTAKQLEQFLPEGALIEPVGKSAYKVTMQAPATVAELLARSAALEPQFAVMRQAFQRPYARLLDNHQDPKADLDPTVHLISNLARVLGARAQCHLFLGQPEEALRDLTLSQDLCRIVDGLPRSEWGMLATLIHVSVTAIDLRAIAEGVRSHAWREAQLAALQEQLQKINFVSDIRKVMLTGPARVSGFYPNATAFDLGIIYGGGLILSDDTNAWTHLKATVVGGLIPRGWVYQKMVQQANGYMALSESSDSAGQIVYPRKVDAVAIMAKSHPSTYNYLVRREGMYRNIARKQTQVQEALVACALERYRLLHHEYPETLDALVPPFLAQVPRDLIGGQPLHYRRADDGKFILYSIGWSGHDGGGVPGKTDVEGDWVWDNPPQ